MSKIIERQLVGNGKITFFELKKATTFLNTAPVGILRRQAVAVTDDGSCAKKEFWFWEDFRSGMWNRVHDKASVVAWLIRHGHVVPKALEAIEKKMEV